jgi:dihydropteroate synthase
MFSLNCKGKLVLIERPLIMGILNLTEDSFYAGSRMPNVEAIKNKAAQMLNEGADILDLGAQSTRPASTRISSDEELKKFFRLTRIILKLRKNVLKLAPQLSMMSAAAKWIKI